VVIDDIGHRWTRDTDISLRSIGYNEVNDINDGNGVMYDVDEEEVNETNGVTTIINEMRCLSLMMRKWLVLMMWKSLSMMK
jgi:hypothetical protein